jgi:hypothetical protein
MEAAAAVTAVTATTPSTSTVREPRRGARAAGSPAGALVIPANGIAGSCPALCRASQDSGMCMPGPEGRDGAGAGAPAAGRGRSPGISGAGRSDGRWIGIVASGSSAPVPGVDGGLGLPCDMSHELVTRVSR